MTPEQRAREEELAAFIRANGECLAGADAINRANLGHISRGTARPQKVAFRFSSAIEQAEKEKNRRKRKLKALTRLTPAERREQIRRYLKKKFNEVCFLIDADYKEYLKVMKKLSKNAFARDLKMPTSTFGRLVNGDHGLATLCNAIMREHTLRTYIATYRHELI